MFMLETPQEGAPIIVAEVVEKSSAQHSIINMSSNLRKCISLWKSLYLLEIKHVYKLNVWTELTAPCLDNADCSEICF